MSEWISVKNRLPQEEQYVLYYCVNYNKVDKTQYYYERFLAESVGTHITHWMPLPEPPK